MILDGLFEFIELVEEFFSKRKRQKHCFDKDNPVIQGTDLFRKLPNGEMTEILVTGYQCKHCGRIMNVNLYDLDNLPDSMNYCENDDV